MARTLVGYYWIMEVKFQKTVGKFVTKTKLRCQNEWRKNLNSQILSREASVD